MIRAHGAHVADGTAFPRERAAVNDLLVAGTVVGLLAGGVMLAIAVGGAAWSGLPPRRPLELTAATLLGKDALEGGAPALLLGALSWTVVSVLVALLFAVMLPRDFPFGSAAMLGAAYSWVVLVVATSVALPSLNPVMREGMVETGGAWVLAYSAFGVTLGLVPLVRRRLLAR